MNPFSLEAETFRILFDLQLGVADRFSDVAGRLENVDLMLRGTDKTGGVLQNLRELSEKVEKSSEVLSAFEAEGLKKLLVALNERVAELPGQLLKSADDQQLKEMLQETISSALQSSIKDAREKAFRVGFELAVDDLKPLVRKVSDEVFGGSVRNGLVLHKKRTDLAQLITENKVLRGEVTDERALRKKAEGLRLAAESRIRGAFWVGLLLGFALLSYPTIQFAEHSELVKATYTAIRGFL